jgi:hypothetical protein
VERHVHTAPKAVSTLPRPKKPTSSKRGAKKGNEALQSAVAVSALPLKSTLQRPNKVKSSKRASEQEASDVLQDAAAVSTLPRSSKGWTDTKGVERRPSTRRAGMDRIKHLGIERNWSAALALFRELQQQSKQPATIFMYNVTLTALARSRRYQVLLRRRSQIHV